jgi:hypothetical protein
MVGHALPYTQTHNATLQHHCSERWRTLIWAALLSLIDDMVATLCCGPQPHVGSGTNTGARCGRQPRVSSGHHPQGCPVPATGSFFRQNHRAIRLMIHSQTKLQGCGCNGGPAQQPGGYERSTRRRRGAAVGCGWTSVHDDAAAATHRGGLGCSAVQT